MWNEVVELEGGEWTIGELVCVLLANLSDIALEELVEELMEMVGKGDPTSEPLDDLFWE